MPTPPRLALALVLFYCVTATAQSCPSGQQWVKTSSGGICMVTSAMETAAESPQPSNDIQKYAAYNIALYQPNAQGGDVVLPFMAADNKVVFTPLPQVFEALNKNEGTKLGRPISYGEVIALIGELQSQANQLKQENDKLWAVVGKSSPTVVVQTPPAPAPAARSNNDMLMKYLLLRQLFPAPQPYQLPMPPVSAPLDKSFNCTTTYMGSMAQTNCR